MFFDWFWYDLILGRKIFLYGNLSNTKITNFLQIFLPFFIQELKTPFSLNSSPTFQYTFCCVIMLTCWSVMLPCFQAINTLIMKLYNSSNIAVNIRNTIFSKTNFSEHILFCIFGEYFRAIFHECLSSWRRGLTWPMTSILGIGGICPNRILHFP